MSSPQPSNERSVSRDDFVVEAIPVALRDHRQWVAWRMTGRDGKSTKVPIDIHSGSEASSTNPKTWTGLEEALAYYRENGERINGIGFVLTADDPFCGIDLDDCIHEDGTLEPWAQEIIDSLSSYTETTPSGKGLHVWVLGRKSGDRCRKGKIEIYHGQRYLTVTGHHLSGTPLAIEPRQAQLDALYQKVFDTNPDDVRLPTAATPPTLTNDEVIRKAQSAANGERFQKLWHGDISDYASASEADLALCSMLAFYVGHDATRIDALVRQSKLYRDKWNRKDYREATIQKSLAGLTETYSAKAGRSTGTTDDDEDLTQGERLTRLCEERIRTFCRDQFGEPHVVLPFSDHDEICRTSSGRFREGWLAQNYRVAYGRPPSNEALKQARIQVEARCAESPCVTLSNRVAWHDGDLWYDLADDLWRGVRITTRAWTVEPLPHCFRRYRHQAGQDAPQHAGDLGGDPRDLLDFCNVPEEAACLFIVTVATYFLPDIPHPVIVLTGEQGTAKTTTSRRVKQLIDPGICGLDVLGVPRDEDRAIQMLDHHWVCPIDNVSKVSEWFSDMLCRAVTGEGDARRKLYTDDDDIIRAYRRCVILNGINNPVLRGDLLDRAILIEAPPIIEARPEEAMERRWREARPIILGSFLTALSGGLRNVDTIARTDVADFRMADFARWGAALAPALGYASDQFLEDYRNAIQSKFEDAVEADPLAHAVRGVVHEYGDWQGTASELLDIVNPESPDGKRLKKLPQTPRGLGHALKRIAPSMRRCGIETRWERDRSHRTIRLHTS